MQKFLFDFEKGLQEKRYIAHALPDRTHFNDDAFQLGLSSHFLLLYEQLGLDFHIAALEEMLRLCSEIRVFPILTLNAEKPVFLNELIGILNENYNTCIEKVAYEFQKGGNEMLVIKRR